MIFSGTPHLTIFGAPNYAPEYAKYGQICIFGAYESAPNMVKWGVPEKILQNAVQTHWPCVNRTPPVKSYDQISCLSDFPVESELSKYRSANLAYAVRKLVVWVLCCSLERLCCGREAISSHPYLSGCKKHILTDIEKSVWEYAL